MKRTLFLMTVGCCLSGCVQSLLNQTAMEQRVIEQFADALDEENEPALRRITSSAFEQKALRSDDVLTDLRVLHLPTGDLSVVEVKKLEGDRREVVVKEEAGGKYQFHLVRDPVKKYWVVDDVMVRQRNKGSRVTKSTTEVMDLLMTLRQFLRVWESGTREEILAMTSPSLTDSLSPLPDEWLHALASRIASNYEDGMARKPEANLNENDAVVKLPAKNGHLLLKITRNDGRWLVDDVENHNHREDNHPGSVRRQADAINAVNGFLTAYAAVDRATLEQITSPKFYSGSLKLADLSLVKLPKSSDVPAEFDIRAYEDQLTFMIPSGNEIIRLDMVENLTPKSSASVNSASRFIVKDVTLYERTTQRQRTLSSVFTAPTRAAFFLKALADRDHKMLSQISTTEFTRATWQRVTPEILAQLPIPDFHSEDMKLTDTHSVSDRTELEFTTGNGMLISCRLVNQNGNLKVDDVQFPNDMGQVTSLRTRLAISVPILEFATAWTGRDMELLQKSCSSDFNRLVWSHLDGMPERFQSVPALLKEPVLDTRVTQERATVRLGKHANSAMTANLVMEHDYWVIDEIRLPQTSGEVVGVRENLRREIAERLLSGSYTTRHSINGHDVVVPMTETTVARPNGVLGSQTSGIQQVSAESSSRYNQGAIQHALYERDKPDDGTALKGAPVTPAVNTRLIGDERLTAAPPQTALANANDATSARSSDGMQVFGPKAKQVAQSFEQIQADEPSASTAVDMTPTSEPAQDTFLYFGPDQDLLSATGEPTNAPALVTAAAPQQNQPRRIRQPSDMPISIE